MDCEGQLRTAEKLIAVVLAPKLHPWGAAGLAPILSLQLCSRSDGLGAATRGDNNCGLALQLPSMTFHERVLNLYARDNLPWVQIFRQDPSGAALQSRCDNQGIPETDARLIFDSKCP